MKIATFVSFVLLAFALAACSPPADTPREPAGTPASPPADTPDEPAGTAAPRPTSEADGTHAFTIGALRAVALRDGTLQFPNDNEIVGVGRTPGEVASLLTAAGLPSDHLELSIQPLLVKAGDRVLLFDTGAGTNMGPGAGKLPASMAAAGIDPSDVTDIFISHAHGDHVGGLVSAAGELSFPNATIHISSPEWAALRQTAAGDASAWQAALVDVIAPKVAGFAPGAEIVPGVVTAVEIRGHTPGHSGYRITSGGQSLLYIGDAMHHFVVSVQEPEWTISFDTDAPTAQASRSALLASAAESGERLYAVHFPFPGLGNIERRADGRFAWVPE